MARAAPPLIPPFRFATVEAARDGGAGGSQSLYRSAYPSLKNYSASSHLTFCTRFPLPPPAPTLQNSNTLYDDPLGF